MDHHLAVGLGLENVLLLDKLLAQFLVILNDTVMNYGHRIIAGKERMGIAGGRRSVRGPAGVTDADLPE